MPKANRKNWIPFHFSSSKIEGQVSCRADWNSVIKAHNGLMNEADLLNARNRSGQQASDYGFGVNYTSGAQGALRSHFNKNGMKPTTNKLTRWLGFKLKP